MCPLPLAIRIYGLWTQQPRESPNSPYQQAHASLLTLTQTGDWGKREEGRERVEEEEGKGDRESKKECGEEEQNGWTGESKSERGGGEKQQERERKGGERFGIEGKGDEMDRAR